MPKSKSDRWGTPSDVYDPLNEEFHFTHDPCPLNWREGVDPDALEIEWGNSVFVNPPYSRCAEFIKKAHDEWEKGGKTIVLLINAITDTRAFHNYILNKAEVRFVAGRIKFVNPEEPTKRTPNVKPSIICIYRPRPQ